MSIIKVTSMLVISGALLNLTGCCESSCIDMSASEQIKQQSSIRPEVVVNFAYNSAELSARDKDILASQIPSLLAEDTLTLQIAGHTDEVGSEAYYYALGERRAKAISSLLESKGVPADRIAIISYGKTRPLVNGVNKQANSLNRRAELDFIINSKIG